MNSTASGGFLHPSPAQGRDELDNAMHDCIAGITGLPDELVRPRWQPDPPKVPEPDVDWCAFGVTRYEGHNLPEIRHHGEGEGSGELVDVEELDILVSFFGPRHLVLARVLRRGLYLPQNREGLRSANIAFVRAAGIQPLPQQVALGWRARADLTLTMRLTTTCTFAQYNLREMQGTLTSDGGRGASAHFGCHACARRCGQ